ncbi:hypothetical protein CN378_09455 [Bacillus sp. AFS015802]|uniref:hypothetical protein n=1 Tax=Bacillus sp. AFS015802 TaxID=2033486 RepID=UPI000BF3FA18|nr:hypothetical protein [Bacillus sp. AFS015802]PFA67740.1 hypothetical protein CN378_09455 [Bacillus sp. AFS015802]
MSGDSLFFIISHSDIGIVTLIINIMGLEAGRDPYAVQNVLLTGEYRHGGALMKKHDKVKESTA